MANDLGANPYHNPLLPADVNADNRVSTMDVLALANDLQRNGARGVTDVSHSILGAQPIGPTSSSESFLDVTNDGLVNQLDVSRVMGSLAPPPDQDDLLEISLQAVDSNNNVLTQVNQGDTFFLRVIVDDLRTGSAARGVFGGYLDLDFNGKLVAPEGKIIRSAKYSADLKDGGGTILENQIDEVGAITTDFNLNGDPLEFFRWQFKAGAGGDVTFTPNPSEGLDKLSLFLSDVDPLPDSRIAFTPLTLKINGEQIPTLSIDDLSVAEGNTGTTEANAVIRLSSAYSKDVTVLVSSAANSAVATEDFTGISSKLVTIKAGQTTANVPLSIVADTFAEPNETFTLTLSSPTNATLADGTSLVTITNDDGAPPATLSFAVQDLIVRESSGSQPTIRINLSQAVTRDVNFRLSTEDDTAKSGQDYSVGGFFTIKAGETFTDAAISLVNDSVAEQTERFKLRLADPGNAAASTSVLAVTVLDDDQPTKLDLSETFSTDEGNNRRQVNIPLTLSPVSNQEVSFVVRTVDNTAKAGVDYEPLDNLKITVPANPSSTTVNVPVTIIGNTVNESNKVFLIEVVEVTNASVVGARKVITLVNDDNQGPATLSIVPTLKVVEGDTGTTQAALQVTLSRALSETVTVKYSTTNGTATAGEDYDAAALQTLTITAGQTTGTINIPIRGDTSIESDETFVVTLSDPSNAELGTSKATTVTIEDNDRPTLTVQDVQIVEGDDAQKQLVFTATLDKAAGQALKLGFSTTTGGTASPGQDYQAVTNGEVEFSATDLSRTFSIAVNGDTQYEDHETINLLLSAPNGVRLARSSVVGTITDNDQPVVVFTQSTAQVNEGNTGDTPVDLTIKLSEAARRPVRVTYRTQAGTADATDFTKVDGQEVTFNVGQDTQVVRLFVTGDSKVEANEIFNVLLSSQDAVLGQTASTVVTINNDDLVTASIAATASVSEGNTGTKNVELAVTLSEAPLSAVTVNFTTEAVTAQAGSDFVAQTGSVTFQPGDPLTKNITVVINGDTQVESDETFRVNLTGATGAVLGTAVSSTVTITNDDAPDLPTISIAAAQADEGTQTGNPVVFTVSLSSVATTDVTVRASTQGETALTAVDFVTVQNQLVTIPAGQTSTTFTVNTLGDNSREGNETFRVTLSNPSANATLSPTASSAVGTIVDDDPIPTITVQNASGTEANPGASSKVVFRVRLSNPTAQQVTLDFTTADGTGANAAVAGTDYSKTNGTLTFAPNVTEQLVEVPILPDTTTEPSRTFSLVLSNPNAAATLGTTSATGTIIDDESAVTINVLDTSVTEGDAGATNKLNFTVRLTAAATQAVNFNYALVEITADAERDFQRIGTTNQGTIAAGQTETTISVNVVGDSLVEKNEMVRLILTQITGANAGDVEADGTILDDDAGKDTLTLYVEDVSQAEGDPFGTDKATQMQFRVYLNRPAEQDVTVRYQTADGTTDLFKAIGGTDYIPTAQGDARPTLTIAKGATEAFINVGIRGEKSYENDELFFLEFSQPTNAQLGRHFARGTIVNDDQAPTISIQDVIVQERPEGDSRVFLKARRTGQTELPVSFQYTLSDGTATGGANGSGADYRANKLSSAITIPATSTESDAFSIAVFPDNVRESDETYFMDLVNLVNAVPGKTRAVITIQDQQLTSNSELLFNVVTVNEQNQPVGSVTAGQTFRLQIFAQDVRSLAQGATSLFTTLNYDTNLLELEPGKQVTFGNVYNFFTNANTTTPGRVQDVGGYLESFNSLNDGPGTQKFLLATIPFRAKANGVANFTLEESTQAVVGNLLPLKSGEDPSNRVAVDPRNVIYRGGAITIGSPSYTVPSVSVTEGDTGKQDLVFTVTLPQARTSDVTFNYEVTSGSAQSGVDYRLPAGNVTIPAGQTTATVTAEVLGDLLDEVDENFLVRFTPSDTALPVLLATGTIQDNDAPPVVSIDPAVSIQEGNSGFRQANLRVRLSAPSSLPVRVSWTPTADTGANAATPETDYQNLSRQNLIFDPGITELVVGVSVVGDELFEPNETFRVVLSVPVDGNNQPITNMNATLSPTASTATVTITNDDADQNLPASFSGKVFVDSNRNGLHDTGEAPLTGVTISVSGTTNSGTALTTRTVSTDVAGTYSFANLPPGKYVVTQSQPNAYLDGNSLMGSGGTITASSTNSFSVNLGPGATASGYAFTEQGISPAFINKRWVASTTTTEVINQWLQDANNRISSASALGTTARSELSTAVQQRVALAMAAPPVTSTASVSQADRVVTVVGTPGSDVIEFSAAGSQRQLKVNGASYTYSADSVDQFVIRGGGGADTATLTGSSGADQAEVSGTRATLSGAGYLVQTTDIASLTLFGNGGNDTAIFRDSAGNDHLEASNDRVALSSPGFYAAAAVSFSNVTAYATSGGRNTRTLLPVSFTLNSLGDWVDEG